LYARNDLSELIFGEKELKESKLTSNSSKVSSFGLERIAENAPNSMYSNKWITPIANLGATDAIFALKFSIQQIRDYTVLSVSSMSVKNAKICKNK
jgi:hypothetical protein